ncbi:hypothetical protein H0H93_001234, partial [Arthromyces matolae]
MEKVFLGVLANATDPAVIRVRGILDFIYYAQFEVHTDETLVQLDAAWVAFHENKKVFEELGAREHFNISKIHNIKHYLDSIRSLGAATGYNRIVRFASLYVHWFKPLRKCDGLLG